MNRNFDIYGQNKTTSDDQLPLLLQFLLFFLAAILVFVSVDYFVHTPMQQELTTMFLGGFLHPKFFSLLDLVMIVISVFLMFKYRLNFNHASTSEKVFFILSIAVFILKLANPNGNPQNPVLGLPLFSEINNYSILLFLGTFICLPKKIFFVIIKKLFTFILIVAITRSVYLLLLFFSGKGRSFFFGLHSTLLEGDTLLFLGLIQSVVFALFLAKKKRKYFVYWSILLLVQIFSTRRSPLFTALLCNIFVFMFYYVRKMTAFNKVVTVLVLMTTLLIAPMLLYNLSPSVKQYVDRYIGVFSTDTQKNEAASDSGHFQQSRETSKAAMKLGFWGVGYGNKVGLEGAFTMQGEQYIHNCYAALWASHGFFMIIFYLILILMVLFQYIHLSLFNNKELFHFAIVKISVAIYFLGYMHSMYYTTLNFFVSTKAQAIFTLVLVFLFKLEKSTFKELLPYFPNETEDSAVPQKYYVSF